MRLRLPSAGRGLRHPAAPLCYCASRGLACHRRAADEPSSRFDSSAVVGSPAELPRLLVDGAVGIVRHDSGQPATRRPHMACATRPRFLDDDISVKIDPQHAARPAASKTVRRSTESRRQRHGHPVRGGFRSSAERQPTVSPHRPGRDSARLHHLLSRSGRAHRDEGLGVIVPPHHSRSPRAYGSREPRTDLGLRVRLASLGSGYPYVSIFATTAASMTAERRESSISMIDAVAAAPSTPAAHLAGVGAHVGATASAHARGRGRAPGASTARPQTLPRMRPAPPRRTDTGPMAQRPSVRFVLATATPAAGAFPRSFRAWARRTVLPFRARAQRTGIRYAVRSVLAPRPATLAISPWRTSHAEGLPMTGPPGVQLDWDSGLALRPKGEVAVDAAFDRDYAATVRTGTRQFPRPRRALPGRASRVFRGSLAQWAFRTLAQHLAAHHPRWLRRVPPSARRRKRPRPALPTARVLGVRYGSFSRGHDLDPVASASTPAEKPPPATVGRSTRREWVGQQHSFTHGHLVLPCVHLRRRTSVPRRRFPDPRILPEMTWRPT